MKNMNTSNIPTSNRSNISSHLEFYTSADSMHTSIFLKKSKEKKKRICYVYIKPSLVEPSLVSYSIRKLMLGMGS